MKVSRRFSCRVPKILRMATLMKNSRDGNENTVRTNSHGGGEGDGGDSGSGRNDRNGRNGDVGCRGERGACRDKGNERLNDEVRRVVKEILGVCEGTFLDLASVLALRICEDTIPHKSYRIA